MNNEKTISRVRLYLLVESWSRYAKRLATRDAILRHYADCYIEGPDPVYNPDGSRR